MDAFQIAEQAQETVAEVYAMISRRFADNADLRALFLLLAEEERRHLQKIRLMGEQWREEGDYWQPTAEMDRLLALMEKTETLLASVLQLPQLSAEQALSIAAKLETDFAQVYNAFLESEDEEQIRNLFELLLQHGPGHAELFARFEHGSTESSPAARRRRQTLSQPPLRAPNDEG